MLMEKEPDDIKDVNFCIKIVARPPKIVEPRRALKISAIPKDVVPANKKLIKTEIP